MITINGESYLTKLEAAQSLGRSVRQLERLFINGDLEKFEYLGGQILAKEAAVEEFKAASLKPAPRTGGRPRLLREAVFTT